MSLTVRTLYVMFYEILHINVPDKVKFLCFKKTLQQNTEAVYDLSASVLVY
jgi:hypothetical protein